MLANTPPYHVYLKALYELYYTDIRGRELPLPPGRGAPLANFQVDAVSQGLAMVEAHGGCYIGDVVGLGKTFVGAELLKQLRVSHPNDGPPLILCPAGLRPMWQHFNERFGLGAEVVSHSMIAAPPSAEFDEETGRYADAEHSGQGIVLEQAYPNRGPVLVDEAHNFRNVNQRSRGLRRYLDSGDHKVVLLSATPQNLGPMDIYRQLTLFIDDTEHGLSIEPISLEQYFHNAQTWLAHRAEYENYKTEFDNWVRIKSKAAPPLPPKRPTVPKADIPEVLSKVFVRRRRKDIREIYGDSAEVDGKPVRFPEPVLDNVDYRLDKVYAKAGSLKELGALLKKHKASRYKATQYLKEDAKEKPEYRDLFRAGDRIAALMGVLLFKRLESSIEAFRSTLSSLMRSNRNFRNALASGYVPIGSTATRLLSGQSFDADDLLEVLQQEEDRRRQLGLARRTKLVHNVRDFEVEQWVADLDEDHDVLTEVLGRVKDIQPEDDDKLRSLREFLDRPEVQSGKVLIFSEAETTIEYLYRELNPSGSDAEIARLTGSNRDNMESIIRRFAPTANQELNGSRPAQEIRVLLATDVVSEGQNLQDCARVLNYDLHWNPVRLIQRFGRIDRIGTEHEVINLHNTLPDTAVDEELSLTERLIGRIQLFHDLIGLDSRLLSETERLNAKDMYNIYERKRLPDIDDSLDEVAANQRAVAILQRIQADEPDLWKTITALPDGIRSALETKSPQIDADDRRYVHNLLEIEGAQAPLISPAILEATPSPFDDARPGETLALMSAGGVKRCYAVGGDLEPRPISPAQLVAAVECERDTPAMPLPPDTNERVMAAFESFRSDYQQRLGRARRQRDTRARRYVSRQLSIARAEAEGNDAELRRLETLRRIFLGEVSSQVESALGEIRNLRLEGIAFRTRLEALRERYRLNPPDDTEGSQLQEPQVVRIVCSDGLV